MLCLWLNSPQFTLERLNGVSGSNVRGRGPASSPFIETSSRSLVQITFSATLLLKLKNLLYLQYPVTSHGTVLTGSEHFTQKNKSFFTFVTVYFVK